MYKKYNKITIHYEIDSSLYDDIQDSQDLLLHLSYHDTELCDEIQESTDHGDYQYGINIEYITVNNFTTENEDNNITADLNILYTIKEM